MHGVGGFSAQFLSATSHSDSLSLEDDYTTLFAFWIGNKPT